MIKTKKTLIASLLVGMTLMGGAGTIANAGTKWTAGLYDGHNGYYMAYGYYYDGEARHYSWATLNGHGSGNVWAPRGQTSVAETDSYPSRNWDADYGY